MRSTLLKPGLPTTSDALGWPPLEPAKYFEFPLRFAGRPSTEIRRQVYVAGGDAYGSPS
jgi:hypothetical protein